MTLLFHAETRSFYDTSVHAAEIIPKDAVVVTARRKQELLDGERTGLLISADDDGKPVLIEPEPDLEAPARAERAWRDSEIQRISWLRDRHRDERDQGRATTLAAEQFSELLAYIQHLRDWPQGDHFPDTSQRPTAPEWLSPHTS